MIVTFDQQYNVVRWKWSVVVSALFPSQSGDLNIASATYTANSPAYSASCFITTPVIDSVTNEKFNNGDYPIYMFYLKNGVDRPSGIAVYSKNGKLVFQFIDVSRGDVTIEITEPMNDLIAGLSSLSVTADNGINHILYNNVTYDTFPATIPLDSATTTMQVESKSPVLTINDGGNLKSVTYGSATFTKFPATVTATTPEFALTARGKDSPVITVRTERTQTPVITNT